MYGRLDIPLLDTDKFVPSGTENNWEIVLKCAKSNFVIVKQSKIVKEFKIEIHGIKLHCRKVQLSVPALNMITSQSRKEDGLHYPVRDTEIFMYSLLEGTTTRTTAETTLKTYPSRIFVFMSEFCYYYFFKNLICLILL